VDRNTILWTLVVFFGATVAFGGIRNLTEGQPVGVTLGLQVVVGLILVGVIVVIVRRSR